MRVIIGIIEQVGGNYEMHPLRYLLKNTISPKISLPTHNRNSGYKMNKLNSVLTEIFP